MSPGVVALLVVAGGVGAVTRFVGDGVLQRRLPPGHPWPTLVINVVGSFVLGVLTGLTLRHGAPESVRAVLGTGFCGGFTTFSTASVETVRLARRGDVAGAVSSLIASVGATLAAAALGLTLTS